MEEVIVVKSDVKNNNVNIELVESQAPVPKKRAFQPSSDLRPVPASRQKVQSLLSMGKNDKNDENEIIQLSSISSDLMNSSQSSSSASAAAIQNISQDSSLNSKKQNTVIVVNEKKKTPNKISVQVFHEPHHAQEPEEAAFHVVSHGKWAKNTVTVAEVVQEDISTESEPPIPTKRVTKTKTPAKQEVQFISENKKVKKLTKRVTSPSSTSTSNSKPSNDSSSEASSSETPEIKKKPKSKTRKKEKTKKIKTKRKLSSENDEEGSVTSRTEESVSETKLKDPVVVDDNRSIGKRQ